MIKEAILKLAKKEDLAYETAQEVMESQPCADGFISDSSFTQGGDYR